MLIEGGGNMPKIRPVSDLRNNFAEITREVQLSGEPVFLTKNGYGTSVLVSIQYFQSHLAMQDVYAHVAKAETEIDAGLGIDARKSLNRTRARING